MLVSLNWLKKYIDINGIDPLELADKITRTGIEVESVTELANVSNVVVGLVVDRIQHPNADKLSVCQVDVGGDEGILQIVCGAKNVAAGQKVIVAKNGAVLPGDFKIKKSKLRGEVSNGMICSLKEIGIDQRLVPAEFSEGIFVCAEDAPIGKEAVEFLGFNDIVIELGLTPNRMDALSMMGVAFEVGAILGKEAIFPIPHVVEESQAAADLISVSLETPKSEAFMSRVVKDVTIRQSPAWMQAALIAAGIRPKNNVVDITNYVMLETGQPLHAYDYHTISTKKIVVREAADGEILKTLDGQERSLTAGEIIITDGVKPIGLAGVMGGLETEVTDQTTHILLESALFDRRGVRGASSRLGLRSEASSRFEKGVDPNRVELALNRAAQLLAEIADGHILKGIVSAGTTQTDETVIEITAEKINSVLGTSMQTPEVARIWERLKFNYDLEGEVFSVSIPTRRLDITIVEDLIEEAGRMYGYDNIPSTLPTSKTKGGYSPVQKMRNKVRHTLNANGLTQVITYSLTNKDKAEQFISVPEAKQDPVYLSMPMSEERMALRQSMLPQLLEAVRYNNARGVLDVAIFEVGTVYSQLSDNYDEEAKVAAVVTGETRYNKWQGKVEKTDFFTAKGYLQGLLEQLGFKDAVYTPIAPDQFPDFHPGRSAMVSVGGHSIGIVGQIHPEVQKNNDLNETFVFEISLQKLYDIGTSPKEYEPIPKHLGMGRDIALVVDRNVPAADLIHTIKTSATNLLQEVEVFDIYEGPGLGETKKSIALSLSYLHREKTLTDEELLPIHSKVLEALTVAHGAVLRS